MLLIAGITLHIKLPVIAIMALVILFILQNYRRPVNVHLLSETIPENLMASGLSAETQLSTIITALFALLLGYLADSFSVAAALSVSGAILGILYLLAKLKST